MPVEKSPTCDKRVLSHSKVLRCSLCYKQYHRQCLPLVSEDDYIYLNHSISPWYCIPCSSEMFPFNHIVEETEFRYVLSENYFDNVSISLEQINTMLFNPFDVNEDTIYSPLTDADPDFNFYNTINSISNNCDYYLEDSFKEKTINIRTNSDRFSLFNLNIRSVPKHFTNFGSYIKSLNFSFTC